MIDPGKWNNEIIAAQGELTTIATEVNRNLLSREDSDRLKSSLNSLIDALKNIRDVDKKMAIYHDAIVAIETIFAPAIREGDANAIAIRDRMLGVIKKRIEPIINVVSGGKKPQ